MMTPSKDEKTLSRNSQQNLLFTNFSSLIFFFYKNIFNDFNSDLKFIKFDMFKLREEKKAAQ